MGRVFIRAFFGERPPSAEHAHEPGLAMTGPLVILAVPSVCAGFFGGWLAHQSGAEYHVHFGLTPLVASSAALLGLITAVFVFGRGRSVSIFAAIERLDRASLVDRSWEVLYRSVMLRIAAILGWIDRYVVDGIMNFVGWSTLESGSAVRRLQTGRVRDYALAVVVGAILLALYGVWR